MASFSVAFLGCKVSYADAQAIRERLLADGHERGARRRRVAVVNTCCVTHEAVRKSRHAASRAARSAPARVRDRLRREPGRGRLRRPPRERRRRRAAQRGDTRLRRRDVGAIGCVHADAKLDRVRAFVKVQDGCSFSCAFCVIPAVRGPSRSRRADAVLRELRRRVDQGHQEIVLTGINLGCYRDREAGYSLARLVRAAGETPGLARLRLSSIEVNHVTASSSQALRETPAVARHLHVPLQSGDDGVLRAMGAATTPPRSCDGSSPLADFNLTTRRDRRLPRRGRGGLPEHAASGRGGPVSRSPRLPVLAPAGHGDRGRRHRSA